MLFSYYYWLMRYMILMRLSAVYDADAYPRAKTIRAPVPTTYYDACAREMLPVIAAHTLLLWGRHYAIIFDDDCHDFAFLAPLL